MPRVTEERKSELQKQAQAKLTEARRLVGEAAELAEEGGFNISFRAGGTYVPSSAFDRAAIREEVIEFLQKDQSDWAELSAEEKEELIEGYVEDWAMDMRPYEAEHPGWWKPSRNC